MLFILARILHKLARTRDAPSSSIDEAGDVQLRLSTIDQAWCEFMLTPEDYNDEALQNEETREWVSALTGRVEEGSSLAAAALRAQDLTYRCKPSLDGTNRVCPRWRRV